MPSLMLRFMPLAATYATRCRPCQSTSDAVALSLTLIFAAVAVRCFRCLCRCTFAAIIIFAQHYSRRGGAQRRDTNARRRQNSAYARRLTRGAETSTRRCAKDPPIQRATVHAPRDADAVFSEQRAHADDVLSMLPAAHLHASMPMAVRA